MGTGLLGKPVMPMGVPLTTPAALAISSLSERAARAREPPLVPRAIIDKRRRLPRIGVVDDDRRGAEVHPCEGNGSAGPPAPMSTAVLSSMVARLRTSSKLRRNPLRSVLWPAVWPCGVMVTVLTAPICRASTDNFVEQWHHGLLAGKGDIDTREAGGLDRRQQVLESPIGQAIEIHQMIVAANAATTNVTKVLEGMKRFSSVRSSCTRLPFGRACNGELADPRTCRQ